jgi:CRP-like cAMP-binding protein
MNEVTRKPYKHNPRLQEIFLPEGTILFEEGDKASAMYIIQTGVIDIAVNNGTHKLASLGSGSSFGEQAILGTKVRTATAIAKERSTCLEIPADWLGDQINASPHFVNIVFTGLTLQLLQRNFLAAHQAGSKQDETYDLDSSNAAKRAWQSISGNTLLDTVYVSTGEDTQKHISNGNALIIRSGSVDVTRGNRMCSLGKGGVLGLAEAIASVPCADSVEVTSAVNAWQISGDSAFTFISQLNKGLYGVVRGLASRVIGQNMPLGRLSNTKK